ncbi:LTA synthase family protein [Enterococcus sp. HY326]|uniref:LTA synthase family protein n=1 Tax=Enterococcus sp. HY326 TaxID=2971265 RepID=UPI003A0FDCC0
MPALRKEDLVKAVGKKIKQFLKQPIVKLVLTVVLLFILVIISNLYLQWSQNDYDTSLAFKFAFSWHVEKFFLGSLVLGTLLVFIMSIAGSVTIGAIFYTFVIGVLGYADYLKMLYREEPIYPDDLKMIVEFGLLREMVGTGPFVFLMILAVLILAVFIYQIYRSFKMGRKLQILRVVGLVLSSGLLVYFSDFNNEDNLLRQAYNKTALWIPYSQQMNYYNVGFVGGFLYNLNVDAMDEPAGYSKEAVQEIVDKYQSQATENNQTATDEEPNIIYVMSESFSDPANLNGITVEGDPLADYYAVADETYSGKMLSQNYGGGTANIEFEALTSLSMGLMNVQMTTPYTMLVSNLDQLPSMVSLLSGRGYQTTAIHPYNTSMYKRQDVYEKLGFDDFLYEDTMTHTDTIENNPYISDAAAYSEIMDLLSTDETPQFVHLVTMQTHMPYSGKYSTLNYSATGNDNSASLNNYLQDIAYSSEALQEFLTELNQLDRRTLVVFWGDHLPGIYSDEIQEENAGATLHETQFLIYDSAGELSQQETHDTITSPFYFAPNLLSQSNQSTTGFYEMLLAVEDFLPAFEKGLYYQGNQWFETAQLSTPQEEIYEEYQMIQYDIVSGEQYSIDMGFYQDE